MREVVDDGVLSEQEGVRWAVWRTYHQAKEACYISLLSALCDGAHPPGCREVFQFISQICGSKFSRKGNPLSNHFQYAAIKILADEQTTTFGTKLGDPYIPRRTMPPVTQFWNASWSTSLRRTYLDSPKCKTSMAATLGVT